jgi:hypothetical protein
MYDEKMKAKHEAIKKIIEEMDNLMMGKMMPKDEEEDDMKETPMEVKVMKLEAKPEEEEEYKMESEDGEAIDMTPIKELRKRLRGK